MARLLQITDVMAQLGMSRSFCYENLAALGAIRVGRRIRFEQSGIDAYVRRRRIRDAAEQPAEIEEERERRRPVLTHKSARNPVSGAKWK